MKVVALCPELTPTIVARSPKRIRPSQLSSKIAFSMEARVNHFTTCKICICKFLENMPTEAKKQRLINNYRQKYKEELQQLQGQTEIPYVDYNEKGNFETINMKKDLSRSLILNEVLHILKLQHNITIQKSWEILEENLRRNPTILRKWLAIKTPIGIKTSPTNFQVGSNRNMKKLLSIAKKIKNKDKISILPHTRQRKNKRKSLYKRIRENRQKRNNKQTEMLHLQE